MTADLEDVTKPHTFGQSEQCIYCQSSSGTSKEHIVPYALGGNHVIPNACCEQCRVITGALEQTVLRGELWAARIANTTQR